MLFGIVLALIIIASILMIVVVLIQPGKGDMATGMGSLSGQLGTMFGSRRATDALTKITIGIAISMLVLTLLANKFMLQSGAEAQRAPATVGAPKPAAAPVQGIPKTQPSAQPQQVQPQQAQPQQNK